MKPPNRLLPSSSPFDAFPLQSLGGSGPHSGPMDWLWHGYLAAGQLTLLTSLWKSGKTTLLLELTRDLLSRAEQDESHPLPFVFNLSSWSTEWQGLVEWLVEELHTKYRVPHKLGRTLVEKDEILPLLDGLDEVDTKDRTACIEAINTYRARLLRKLHLTSTAGLIRYAIEHQVDMTMPIPAQPKAPREPLCLVPRYRL